jgi:hypothetical protein
LLKKGKEYHQRQEAVIQLSLLLFLKAHSLRKEEEATTNITPNIERANINRLKTDMIKETLFQSCSSFAFDRSLTTLVLIPAPNIVMIKAKEVLYMVDNPMPVVPINIATNLERIN